MLLTPMRRTNRRVSWKQVEDSAQRAGRNADFVRSTSFVAPSSNATVVSNTLSPSMPTGAPHMFTSPTGERCPFSAWF